MISAIRTLALLAAVIGMLARPSLAEALPTVEAPSAAPNPISAGVSAKVLVTCRIVRGAGDPTVAKNGAVLVQSNAGGALIRALGTLHDDGKSGDATAGDSIFSVTLKLDAPVAGQLFMRATVLFTGIESTTLSPLSSLTVLANGLLINQGLTALQTGNLHDANARFLDALTVTPEDPRAKLFSSITRVATVALENAQLRTLLTRSGSTAIGTSQDLCGLDVQFPPDSAPTSPTSEEVRLALTQVFVPELQTALTQLQSISSKSRIVFDLASLPPCWQLAGAPTTIEIDRADILALIGLIQAARASAEMAAAYDVEAPIQTKNQTPQAVVQGNQDLLTLRSSSPLGPARQWLDQALRSWSDAIKAARGETDDQGDDVLVILPQDLDEAEHAVLVLDQLRRALKGEQTLPVEAGLPAPERVNFDPFFDGLLGSLRPLLPAFDARGEFDRNTFPDPTLGGAAPDLTQAEITHIVNEGEDELR
jgi:hypothetical protein